MLAEMELRHLRYFVAVAREENVTRAALRLHVSQPALSRQIRDLEDDLGALLFERSAKAVRLTAAGRVFLGEAEAVLRRAEDAVAKVRSVAAGHGDELHVGYSPMPTVRWLPPAVRAFRQRWAGVRLRLHDLSPEEMLGGLHAGRLHLAFLVRPTRAMLRGLQFEEFGRDVLRMAVGRNHPLAKLRSITTARLRREALLAYSRKDYPEYHVYLAELFGGEKQPPRVVEEFDDGVGLVTALETGAGVAVLPQSLQLTTGSRLKLIPIVPAPPPVVIGVASVPSRLTAAAGRFLEVARELSTAAGGAPAGA